MGKGICLYVYTFYEPLHLQLLVEVAFDKQLWLDFDSLKKGFIPNQTTFLKKCN